LEKVNACIVSFYMKNVDRKTVELQAKVVDKFNISKYPHYSILTDMPHGASIDYFWGMNGVTVSTMKDAKINKVLNHDYVLILDIDCIPVNTCAIDYYIKLAVEGKLAGNAQRSGHIENGKHVFSAPSASAISLENFIKIGCPSALETPRGDVLEEYTYKAEEHGVPVEYFMPLRFDEAPKRMAWETNQEPFWRLGDGMPNYGMGTTYGTSDGVELFYHNFQIFHGNNQERFQNKCNEVLNGK
jgi:hypothetical protein